MNEVKVRVKTEMDDQNQVKDTNWEKDLLSNLASDALKERRRGRRWGIFFKLLTFSYIGLLLFVFMQGKLSSGAMTPANTSEHVALIELNGVIAPGEGVSADQVVGGLRDAFDDKRTKAVILRINSPGGSPVQSSYINKEIKRLRDKHEDIPLYAVVADICASGGYYVAAAADKIYVNESSIVGSIGVLMNGFGFVDGMQKLGIERRLLTAGEHKGMLDPFSPLQEAEQAHAQIMLDDLHQTFIDVVKAGRGDRLQDNDQLFTGKFWSGNKAIELGLADEIGSASYVAREVVGVDRIVDFTDEEDPIELLAKRFGASVAESIRAATEWDMSWKIR